MPPDYYNVFKNITRFSYILKEDIEKVLDMDKYYSKFFSTKEFRGFRYKNVHKNTKSYGIPQGSGISSIYANIYLIDFDKQISRYVEKFNGIYRRYCDDLIIVIPFTENINDYNYNQHKEFLLSIKNEVPNLVIQPEKTGDFFYYGGEIKDTKFKKTKLDYLGFSFDGSSVRIREKSLFKYYSRTYKKVRFCNIESEKFGRKSYRRGLYKSYSHLGKRHNGYGNFISYALRSQRIFGCENTSKILIHKQVKNHWARIHSRL